MEAALDLFGRTDFAEVSAEDIAVAAGVSRPLFYRYFTGKSEIYLVALRTATARLVDRFTAPAEGPPPAQLRDAIGTFFDFAQNYRSAYIALLGSGSAVAGSETGKVVEHVRAVVVQELLRRSGVEDPSPMLLLTLRAWTSVVEGTVLAWLQDGPTIREDLETWLVDQLVAMVGATARRDPATAVCLARSDLVAAFQS